VTVTAADGPVFWQDLSQGPRPALAIHCALARSAEWVGVAERLSGLRLRAFDLPGHGLSADWPGGGDYLAAARDWALGFMDEPVDLIGHSLGGVVALAAAEARPEAVRSLTLIEPVLFAAATDTPEWRQSRRDLAPFDEALRRGDQAAAARAFNAVWGVSDDWDGLGPRMRDYLIARIRLIPETVAFTEADGGGLLAEGALERLEMPVMLIHGTRSPPIAGAVCEAIAARLPDVGVATVQGAGHMVPLTHPAQTAGLIAANLERA